MQSLARILLPVDFSERSAGAVRYARALAAHFQSELILLHVLVPPQYEFGAVEIGGSMLTELYQDRSRSASRALEEFLPGEFEGLRASRILLEGDPSQKIVDYAHEHGCGLIIMPTHGFGPYRRFILGSNTAKVLHDADCPVWTGVHLEDAPLRFAPFRNVLCALDLGPQSRKTLAWAAFLAREFSSSLSVMHVSSCAPGPESASGMRGAASAEVDRLLAPENTSAAVLIETGDPATAICSAAARLAADVLVIGRGSAAGVFGRLRTNAYGIIRQSPCPVVSV